MTRLDGEHVADQTLVLDVLGQEGVGVGAVHREDLQPIGPACLHAANFAACKHAG